MLSVSLRLLQTDEARELADYYRGDRAGFALAAEEACVDVESDLNSGEVKFTFADGSAAILWPNGGRRLISPRHHVREED